ncbi:hypothetical protein SPRG_03424 [Saprolegnia parasitica CBS 223.65]|uniref:F-box domain-containing protein n=1 Tax=Saprolegnia parasitica (strain CBS 223.65) TaxID=695850 RepID=A0A067CZK8_SAPPC|nr:hypothetical protein SPRG_03424 [Saprolegnia parasitica CBS 223.65]KDO32207.1 hypothetical protein SPRG_03424 [Saprolegnia parasitica CBS 223.65]|eukprot:XP_012197387.1 hypothetical protein SPRG_03424 [Saprolegnia parasitica CBS 223.65]
MATIVASCPRLARLHLSAMDEVVLQSCDGLLDWLARPSARLLKLDSIEFAPRAAKTLARVLLSSTTLRTIMLFYTPHTRDAFFDPTAPPLPRQLRKLTIELDANWDITPALFDKLATSAVTRLHLRSDVHRDVAPVVAALAPTLKALKLDEAKMKRLPPLPVLQYLQLSDVTLASEAVVDLASLLVTSTSLFRLDLRHSELPDDQLQTILYALPRWLSRQQRTCYVYLSVSPETETLVTAALLRTRNTLEVQLEINSAELAVCQRLLTVLGATSRMKMRFICLGDRICNHERLETHARLQRVETESSWLLSPSTTPWVSLA